MHETAGVQIDTDSEGRLREAGLRVTRPRLAVMAAVELNALVGVSPGRQKYLTTVSGTIHAGLGLTLVLYLLSLVNS